MWDQKDKKSHIFRIAHLTTSHSLSLSLASFGHKKLSGKKNLNHPSLIFHPNKDNHYSFIPTFFPYSIDIRNLQTIIMTACEKLYTFSDTNKPPFKLYYFDIIGKGEGIRRSLYQRKMIHIV